MTIHADNLEDVLSVVNELAHKPKIISIDGRNGVGKSTLSRVIFDNFDSNIFELDYYLFRKLSQNYGYRESICFSDLLRDIAKSKQENIHTIVEGVCVLEILKNISIIPDFKIYVDNVKYHFDNSTVLNKSSDIATEEIPEECYFDLEIKEYHERFIPRQTADLIFERR